MSNGIKTNSAEEIIDLTDLVSIGNGAGEADDTPKNEEDVLDSLVNDFENDKGGTSGSETAGTSDDAEEVLDLSNLDNLISSYNLDLGENSANNQDTDLDTNFDAILNDIKNDVETGDPGECIGTAEPNALQDNELELKDFAVSEDFDTDAIPSLEDMDFPSLEKDEDEIDLLTKDIIDGTDREPANIADNAAVQSQSAGNGQPKNAFSEMLEDELGQNDVIDLSKEDEFSLDGLSQSSLGAGIPETPQNKPQAKKTPDARQNASLAADDEEFKSDMAEEAEEMDDSEFDNILNELSLEHETDEEVVPFAHEASSDTMPIHLKGDIRFLETPKNGQDHNDDINLVQSASKVLASDEAYLEKFDGEDDSVGARIKSLSTQMVSLEHRLIGSDSKWQDYGLELNYRISGLETKITELEVAIKEDFAEIRSEIGAVSRPAESNGQQDTEALAQLTDKIRAIETKIATLDDIFSEQKMLNDELAKNLDSLMERVDFASAASPERSEPSEISGGVQVLEEKIAFLESELAGAQAKIFDLETNIEKAASLAAARVLREEIIPLLGK